MEIKPLLVYLQAADYPEILEELEKIPCDKLILKYFPYPHPHNIARDFFLKHTEYTHLIIQPQDLKVTKEHYEKMFKNIYDKNYPVLSAVCNVGKNGVFRYKMAVCKELPAWNRYVRYYNWIPSGLKGINQVKFQGHVFVWIKRDVVERRNIYGDYIFRGSVHVGGEPAPDLTFCTECDRSGIPIHADCDCNIEHLATHEKILVGKKKVEIIYKPEKQRCHVISKF